MNIRWLSPLNPEKTEIGRYTQGLLPYLHRDFALHVVTDSATEHYDYHPDNAVVGMESINIYNLGNSYLHIGILKLAMEQPGIVILHDVSLLELGLAYARDADDICLKEIAGAEYGADASLAFDALYDSERYDWRGRSQQQYDDFVNRYPLFQTFMGSPRGVVVHSDYAMKHVQRKYDGPVVRLNLPYEAPPMAVEARIFEPPFQMIFCGHAGPNRRLRQFIEAWQMVSQPELFRLQLFGNIDKADEILELADSAGLGGLVDVVGFVSDEALDQAISQAHIAINLRNPTMGEASASQLRYWSRSVPSLVSDVGWYGELPDEVVIKVAPDREREDIVAALEQFAQGNSAYFDRGRKGYEYLVRQHSVEGYIQSLQNFVTRVSEERFVASIFDDRLVPVMASMCDDVNDSGMFEATLEGLSGMVDGLEKRQF